ncbi:MAG: sodium:proline symporter [Rhodocyclaceae bacterium]|nr:sodium:proline symporter [Rhodocyclaceae bacterium]
MAIALNRSLRFIVLSGVFAGTVATLAQLLLWWLTAVPLPDVLYRDTRLTAAILLPRSILAPESLFQAPGMLALLTATAIHFTLSMLYSAIFFYLTEYSKAAGRRPLMAGLVFGLALYGVNMYGFTLLMPWFGLVRDCITIAAHAVFGLCLGLAVRANTRRKCPLLPI